MKYIILPAALLLIGLMVAFYPTSTPEEKAISEIEASPAQDFLASLSPKQLKKAQWTFDNPTRIKWHFLPGAMWKRAGIKLNELNPEQKALVFNLLESHLSQTGYDKVQSIIDLEYALQELGETADYRDPEKYFVAIYGTPSADSLWAWSFEGHHISLNFTISNNNVAMVPRFLGSNPAEVRQGKRKGLRVLAAEEDLGFDLVRSLSSEQLSTTMIQSIAFEEIVTANESVVQPLEPAGISMDALKKDHQNLLWKILNTYLSTMPEALAAKRLQELQKERPGDIRFGWAGSLNMGEGHYYRIQGKSFLVEFDNTQNNANHVHTVWRDFEGDFGKDVIREHYHHDHNH